MIAVATGVPFGTAMAAFTFHDGSSVLASVIGGAVLAVVFGSAMSFWMVRYRNAERVTVGASGAARHRAAERSLTGRSAPVDPSVQAAAVRLGEHRLQRAERQRRWAMPLFGVGAMFYVAAGVVGSPWWWTSAAFFAAMLALTAYEVRLLRRRLARLTAVS